LYCFTYINSFQCVINELMLWSDVSSEHPIFIKTVAQLTNKKLSKTTLEKLMEVNKMFSDIKKKTIEVKKEITPYLEIHQVPDIRGLVQEFLRCDEYFLSVLPEVMHQGKDDKTFQTLLEHITDEQKFMYEIMTDLKVQLGG
jgi:hypothetical protein